MDEAAGTVAATTHSVVDLFYQQAADGSDRPAVLQPCRKSGRYHYRPFSFAELKADVECIARGLRAFGVNRQTRLVLAVPHGYLFIALTFAILRSGATLVLIDPGMGRRSVLGCLQQIAPQGFVGVPLVHFMRAMYAKRFPQARNNVMVGNTYWPGTVGLTKVKRLGETEGALPELKSTDQAAIIFTSGSTGPAKGVLFTHANFVAQAEQIRDYYRIKPGGMDLAAFPLFGLFNAAMGTTTVIPDMNAAKPGTVDPRRFVQHLRDLQINQCFASPAVWNAVGRYCHQQQVQLPSLRRALVAGAPVPPRTLRWITSAMPSDGEVHTPYGATEALPVASITAKEILQAADSQESCGKGTCVGTRFPEIAWKLIEISDEPIDNLSEVREMPAFEVGELIVRGPQVTRSYVASDAANRVHKILDGDTFWHRLGDVGYFDERQRFWFCGRKSHRVVTQRGTLFSVPIESIFNEHPEVYRSALVGLGTAPNQIPVVICEPWPEKWPRGRCAKQELIQSIAKLVSKQPASKNISPERILLKRSLPVDVRHNSKIFREQLVPWAGRQVRFRGTPSNSATRHSLQKEAQ